MSLHFEITSVPDAIHIQQQLYISLRFTNHGNMPVRLLNRFEPLPVFFSFHILKADNTPIYIPGMGKIDFGPEPLDYVELSTDGSWTVDVNLGLWIHESLPAGLYTVSATYHNQYGEGCFIGRLNSNTVSIELIGVRGR